MKSVRDSSITVIGIGGVGGYLTALLARYSKHVTLVARGKRRESLEHDGIRLNSDYKGNICSTAEHVVETIDEITEVQDYIFICVKNYALDDILGQLNGITGEHTMIIPVMNGVEAGDKIRRSVKRGMVADATIHIVSYVQDDYSIRHIGRYSLVRFGIENPSETEKQRLSELEELLKAADIDCERKADIQAAVWNKYMLNCAYNVLTAYYDTNIGGLRAEEQRRQEYMALLQEAVSVAAAQEIAVFPDFAEQEYDRFLNKLEDEAGSSLQRDMHEGKQNELETFSGYLTRKAKELNVAVPVSERMYRALKERSGYRYNHKPGDA